MESDSEIIGVAGTVVMLVAFAVSLCLLGYYFKKNRTSIDGTVFWGLVVSTSFACATTVPVVWVILIDADLYTSLLLYEFQKATIFFIMTVFLIHQAMVFRFATRQVQPSWKMNLCVAGAVAGFYLVMGVAIAYNADDSGDVSLIVACKTLSFVYGFILYVPLLTLIIINRTRVGFIRNTVYSVVTAVAYVVYLGTIFGLFDPFSFSNYESAIMVTSIIDGFILMSLPIAIYAPPVVRLLRPRKMQPSPPPFPMGSIAAMTGRPATTVVSEETEEIYNAPPPVVVSDKKNLLQAAEEELASVHTL
jgi:hypothetical protein